MLYLRIEFFEYNKDDKEYNSMKADLDNCVKALKTFNYLPNTFMGYKNNPAIWVAVVNDGIKYLDCLKAVGNPDIIKAVNKILSEIAVAKTNAQNFKIGDVSLYNCSGCYQYYFNAVSANERKDWFARRSDFNSDVEDSPLLYKYLARSLKKVQCNYSPNRLQSMLDNFSPIKNQILEVCRI